MNKRQQQRQESADAAQDFWRQVPEGSHNGAQSALRAYNPSATKMRSLASQLRTRAVIDFDINQQKETGK